MSEAARFNPRDHLRQLRGKGGQVQDYLDVKYRIVWFRDDYPCGTIDTEMLRLTDDAAVFRATVCGVTADGEMRGRATGTGSETRGDFGDFIEKAETKAIGRALNALGYGAESSMGDDDAEAGGVTNAPVERPAAPQRAPQRATAVAAPSPPPTDDPMPTNVEAAIKRTMAAAGQAKLTEQTVKLVIEARYGVASRKDLTERMHTELRAWFASTDPTGWANIAEFARSLWGAADLAALQSVATQLGQAGVDDQGLRAIYKRRVAALREDGAGTSEGLPGMPAADRRTG